MKCERKDISTVVKEFTCTFSKEDVDVKVNEMLDEWCKRAKIDGFRPGKAPRALVLKNFQRRIENDALRGLARQAFEEVRSEEKDRPVFSEPRYRVVSYTPGGECSLVLTLEYPPQFELKPLKDVKLEKVVCELTPKDLEDRFATFKKDYKKFQPIDGKAEKGDAVTVSFHTVCMGRPIKELTAENVIVHAGEVKLNVFNDPVSREVIGHAKGDEFSIDIQMPRGIRLKSCEGRPVTVSLSVQKVERNTPASFTDEEAKSLGFDSVESFKKAYEQSLTTQHESSLQLCRKKAVLDALASAYDFDIPLSLVNEEFIKIWRFVKPELDLARETDDEDVRGKTDAEIQQEYRDLAMRRVRLGFILNKIAEEQSIRLSEEQVNRAVMRALPQDPTAARQFIRRIQRDSAAFSQVLAPALEEVVIDKIFDSADVTEKKLSSKEFDELVKDILPSVEDDDLPEDEGEVETEPEEDAREGTLELS